MYIVGIDPGEKGGFAIYSPHTKSYKAFEYAKMTPKDIAETLQTLVALDQTFCVIEKVHAAPGQGVVSMFTFGRNYGMWLGILTAVGISFEEITPQVWQGNLGIKQPRGATYSDRKRLLKQKAQQLFPDQNINLANADAFLICEFARRLCAARNK